MTAFKVDRHNLQIPISYETDKQFSFLRSPVRDFNFSAIFIISMVKIAGEPIVHVLYANVYLKHLIHFEYQSSTF